MSIFLQLVDNLHENVMHPSGKYGQHLANTQSVSNFPGDFNKQVAYSVLGHSGAVISLNDHNFKLLTNLVMQALRQLRKNKLVIKT